MNKPFLPQPKLTRIVNSEYRAFVATFPCVVENDLCKPDIVCAHAHAGGHSTKCSDFDTFPACFTHHSLYDNHRKDWNDVYPNKIEISQAKILRAWAELKHKEMQDE